MRPKLAWSIDDLEEEEVEKKKASQYDDLWNLDNRNKKQERSNVRKEENPTATRKDLLLFIEEYSRELEDWQRDILTMMREEMLYFWPQLEKRS